MELSGLSSEIGFNPNCELKDRENGGVVRECWLVAFFVVALVDLSVRLVCLAKAVGLSEGVYAYRPEFMNFSLCSC